MRANEVVRFHCGDCQSAFDLCVRGERETEDTQGAPPVLDLCAGDGAAGGGADRRGRTSSYTR